MEKRLISKLEELKSLVKTFAEKKSNPLVPSLEMPKLKPISLSSTKIRPTKIPGLSPSTNKDPVKVAEQLKNARPMKPKIEVLKTAKNGQWSLEKMGPVVAALATGAAQGVARSVTDHILDKKESKELIKYNENGQWSL